MIRKELDFIAVLKYRTTQESGWSGPAYSGYRPQVKFPFAEKQTSGDLKFIEKEVVYPGEIVNAEVRILSADFFSNKLEEGMSFEFREGTSVIGTGTIKEIVNKNLLKQR